MTLEAGAFQVQQDPFNYGCKDFHVICGGNDPCSYDFGFEEGKAYRETLEKSLGFGFSASWNWNSSPASPSSMVKPLKEWDHTQTNSSSPEQYCNADALFGGGTTGGFSPMEVPTSEPCRRKRRRAKSVKNKEEIENQRMTHIAVERNRRKQMNDYLAVLRFMMPASYVQRGDQASIIGGAINYVKELEQLLQSLEARKGVQKRADDGAAFSSLFSDFFSFHQYSSASSTHQNPAVAATSESMATEKQSAIANVEVTMVESHANIKILSKKYPKQLFELVTGFQSQGLYVLHLNITTVEEMALYSFSVKVEENCQLSSVNEIAAAAYEMVGRIQKESCFKSDDK